MPRHFGVGASKSRGLLFYTENMRKGRRMKKFMDRDFLLEHPMARKLYRDYAAKTPILDYHCHIDPREIYEDRKFANITQLWLGGDHYKWRQMRANGVEEQYITGDAPDREKFQKWAETLEKAIGNPLYHWSHLELSRYFGYEGVLNRETAEEVWKLCNKRLETGEVSARKLLIQSHVTLLCTTDDPADSLLWHEKLAAENFAVKVLPAWRPDRAMHPEKEGYAEYLERLTEASKKKIESFAGLLEALKARMDFFASMGCRTSDHGLSYVAYAPAPRGQIEEIFARGLRGEEINALEAAQFQTAFLLEMGREYHRKGWVMQLHYGVKRDNSRRLFKKLGPDAGIDCINTYTPSAELADFLNALDETDELPKTILYSLNPADNAAIGTILGCFQDGTVEGKLQQGSAWWFNDHKQGMTEQLTSLANLGLLGNFVGMLTDSRSFLSYTRHEYFRRILCNLLGGWVENGEYPADEKALGKMVQDICYDNAMRYFGFGRTE